MQLDALHTIRSFQNKAFILWVITVLISISSSIILQSPYPLLIPLVIMVAIWVAQDYRILYYLLFIGVVFSVEVYLPNGLGTDIPSEQFMWLITGIAFLWALTNIKNLNIAYVSNPIGGLLLVHILWISFTTITSQNQILSLKFLLAKIWYVIPFYFFLIHCLKDRKFLERILWILVIGLSLVVLYVLIRHYPYGFSFDSSNKVVRPIYRNHVDYAAILVIVLPYVWGFWKKTNQTLLKNYLLLTGILFLVGIYFSYTRAAMGSVFIAIGAYYIVKYQKTKQILTAASIIAILSVVALSYNNNYLRFAPDFEKTIMHDNFDNLLEATYNMEDLSSMERVYRWVAGAEMIKQKPMVGFGPNCFYSFYKSYTVESFQTYVSNNPDHSGIHNYYLMTFVEQGFPGFLIWMALCFTLLIYAEKAYHKFSNPDLKHIIMASTLSLFVILTLLLINDLIETDKVGSFFFLSASIVSYYNFFHKPSEKNS